MLFNSFSFLIFFVAVTSGYFLLPQRLRWAWLLAASCYFYMYFIPKYIFILAGTILVDYGIGIALERARGSERRWLLCASLIANIGVLAFFKYFDFLNGNLTTIAHAIGWNYGIDKLAFALPIGLSFHTFQAMSYTIEVYRGHQRAERHLGIYALYVMFFPQLVAGPIERPQNLLHQFREPHTFDPARATSGLRLIAYGMAMKTVVADHLAPFVNLVYAHPRAFPGPLLAAATAAFAFQIYYDFAGYSAIARGAARFMGFELMRNFDDPYHAASIAEFWRRWHISLSTWFRDYLYIPLGGSRVGATRRCANLMIVFLVSGLWHGASWTFIIWGGLHGAYMAISTLLASVNTRLAQVLRLEQAPRAVHLVSVLWVFLLVCFGWIFFRAATLPDAWAVVGELGRGWSAALDPHALAAPIRKAGLVHGLCVALLGLLAVEAFHLLRAIGLVSPHLSVYPWWIRWPGYYAVGFGILMLGAFGQQQFIYFQF